MLQRLYVHNYRCLENFEFKPGSSALLIGRNGTGKSTIARVLRIFQALGRGTSRVGQLLDPKDFTLGRTTTPMRLELEAKLGGRTFRYTLALELPESFRELRVLEERLAIDGVDAYTRQPALASLQPATQFPIDWHLVALPVIQARALAEPLGLFRQWLARMLIFAPVPRLMSGDSTGETLEPLEDGSNFADWFSGLLSQFPAAYAGLHEYLRQVMPDLGEIRNLVTGRAAKSIVVQFQQDESEYQLCFDELSDGEKCFFLCAMVLAAQKAYGPLCCFWDEPDNHLALSEVGHFVTGLRRAFQRGGQFIVTSHNEETIRRFSRENTWLLSRASHFEPAQLRLLDELPATPDLIQSLLLGELEA